MAVNSAFTPSTNISQPTGYGVPGSNGLFDAYGSNYASPDRYDYYQKALGDYTAANSTTPIFAGGNALDWAEAQPAIGSDVQGLYEQWRGTLTPSQLDEYDQVVNSHSDKRTSTMRGGFIAALAAMTGGAALAGAAEGGAAGAGVLGSGAGDAGAGLGWMGGADGVGLGTMGDIAGTGSLGAAVGPGTAGWGTDLGTTMPFAGDAATTGAAGVSGATGATGTIPSASPWETFWKGIGSPLGQSLIKTIPSAITAITGATAGNKAAGQYDDLINQINELYSPDSPYAKQMRQALERKDAAAGRNSQYGDRSVQLAAALTNSKMQALTSAGMLNAYAQRVIGQNQAPGSLNAFFSQNPNLITQAGSGIANWMKGGNTPTPTIGNSGTTTGGVNDYLSPNANAGGDVGMADWMYGADAWQP